VPGANLVDQRLCVLGPDPKCLGALAPVALQLREALDLHLAAQGIADYLAASLAQALGEGVGLFGEIVREGDGEKATHMKKSYRLPSLVIKP
jgi:hypothetical protein